MFKEYTACFDDAVDSKLLKTVAALAAPAATAMRAVAARIATASFVALLGIIPIMSVSVSCSPRSARPLSI
jgi:hypothetical protein